MRDRRRRGAGRTGDSGRHRRRIRRRAADPAGRPEYIAAVELKVDSLARTAERLRGVAGVRVEKDRIVVPARAAFNATLVFTQ